MEPTLEPTAELLRRTPAVLDALLRGLPDRVTRHNEGQGTWNAAQIVAHLIHCERIDWMVRARVILDHGETRPFDPFDREGNQQESAATPLGDLLDEFVRLRRENLAALEAMNLTVGDLARRGRHPALGSVTLGQLLAAWAVHDLTHLHQLTRVLAHPYREQTGSWSKFLGVLHCNGHGAAA